MIYNTGAEGDSSRPGRMPPKSNGAKKKKKKKTREPETQPDTTGVQPDPTPGTSLEQQGIPRRNHEDYFTPAKRPGRTRSQTRLGITQTPADTVTPSIYQNVQHRRGQESEGTYTPSPQTLANRDATNANNNNGRRRGDRNGRNSFSPTRINITNKFVSTLDKLYTLLSREMVKKKTAIIR